LPSRLIAKLATLSATGKSPCDCDQRQTGFGNEHGPCARL
jgi:hypothetical protein